MISLSNSHSRCKGRPPALQIGSKVRLIGIPNGLPDPPDLRTKSTFAPWVGHEFFIAGFNKIGMARLDIGSVTGSFGETIWVETEFFATCLEQLRSAYDISYRSVFRTLASLAGRTTRASAGTQSLIMENSAALPEPTVQAADADP